MKLRFDVDQAECFRRGIDCPKSIVTVEVNPQTLSQQDRDLIADRMVGIDVCVRAFGVDGSAKDILSGMMRRHLVRYVNGGFRRILADAPTFEALMEAVRKNEADVVNDETVEMQAEVSSPAALKRMKEEEELYPVTEEEAAEHAQAIAEENDRVRAVEFSKAKADRENARD